jgi:2-oxo-4-hydroxy-4-carboxy--5-ureidoimidazoline (OHCU) decarboxylase
MKMDEASFEFELTILNNLDQEKAYEEFLRCCGSSKWARTMESLRPFATVNDLLVLARETWWKVDQEDWLEAFRAHPKIGEFSI